MKKNVQKLLNFIVLEFQKEGAYLFPLRVFIGIGWMRATIEKIISPHWHDGAALHEYFQAQITTGAIRFPFYETLLQEYLSGYASALSWLILLGQMLVGLSILTGLFMTLGLLGGLFMNINFILAGSVNPSAFYVVIQMALLFSHSATILSGDSIISMVSGREVARQPNSSHNIQMARRWGWLGAAFLLFITGIIVIPFIEDFTPHSVDDSAMILFVLAILGSLSTFINYLRVRKHALKPRPL